jgi:lysyl endopeptidase
MDGSNRGIAGLLWLWFSLWCAACLASNQVDVVHQDLAPLIRAGALSPNQFAVLVPHKITIQSAGAWSVHGGVATWRYTARIPTAISMSFHADKVSLPSTARLAVSGGSAFIYSARDVHKGVLWSRITPGDSLNFTLTVATTERSRVALELLSLQAGYRGLGGGVTDHPLYRMLKAQAASSSTSTCVQNYQCSVTTANATPAAATVGLLIENLYQCTGSLINDVPGDDVPYVLTARHCETGQLGGGNPSVASAVTVYWNAVSPCGQTLGSLYDPGIVTQTGAATIVEQQDACLIQLDTSPVVTNAQLTGFDASGGAVQGGYTIQHSLGYNKQFTEWFGQATRTR